MIFEEKQSLRAEIRHRLKTMGGATRDEATGKICRHLESTPEWAGLERIGGYYSLADEPAVETCALQDGKMWFFPRVEENDLVFYQVRDFGEMQRGSFGVMEPDPVRCARVDAGELDVILVPGMAFDPEGRRLGRGRGFYDRLLEQLPQRVRRWGVCFQTQMVTVVPVEAHDARVDRVVTEEGWQR